MGDLALEVKLASIIVHLFEYTRPGGSHLDHHAAVTLAEDPDVIAYMASLDRQSLLPVPRDGVRFGPPEQP